MGLRTNQSSLLKTPLSTLRYQPTGSSPIKELIAKPDSILREEVSHVFNMTPSRSVHDQEPSQHSFYTTSRQNTLKMAMTTATERFSPIAVTKFAQKVGPKI